MKHETLKIRKRWMACFLILCTLFCACAAEAQNKGLDLQKKTPEQRAEQQTSMMKKELKPDAAQLEKIKAINLKYAHKFQPIINSEESKMSRFKQARDLQKEKEAELKALLTAEQYKKYEALKKEMKNRLKNELP